MMKEINNELWHSLFKLNAHKLLELDLLAVMAALVPPVSAVCFHILELLKIRVPVAEYINPLGVHSLVLLDFGVSLYIIFLQLVVAMKVLL